jgi:hypothetical protein
MINGLLILIWTMTALKNPTVEADRVSQWNLLSCYDVCTVVPQWSDTVQLKASNIGSEMSLLEYFGSYSSFYAWDTWIYNYLNVTMCDQHGNRCHEYSNFLGTIRLTAQDHRFDIRLSKCFHTRTALVRIQIIGLEFPEQLIPNDGCFLSVMINRNPYLHAYLMQQTQVQNSAVDIMQIMLGQYFLCASQSIEVLQWLSFDYVSIAVALVNVYNIPAENIAAILKCSQVPAYWIALALKDVYLESPETAEEYMLSVGFNNTEVYNAVIEAYGASR